jgi:hypothetical protein
MPSGAVADHPWWFLTEDMSLEEELAVRKHLRRGTRPRLTRDRRSRVPRVVLRPQRAQKRTTITERGLARSRSFAVRTRPTSI